MQIKTSETVSPHTRLRLKPATGSLRSYAHVNLLAPNRLFLPLYESRVPAGAPAAASDDVERHVTLNDILLHHPAETFLLRVTGDSMTGAGMEDGDLLTVDCKLVARSGDIVVACLDGQTTVKTLQQHNGAIRLLPHNNQYPPIQVPSGSDFAILGVVTNIIRSLY